MIDRVGQQFGNYRLVTVLGQGGYAQVYLGQHVRLPLQAAVKVLHTHLTSSEAEGFQREAETIARLAHPSIVRILDYDVQEDLPFLVMDYAPGGSLRRRYPKGSQVSLPLLLASVKQVAAALQYAHEHKVIHRDVKPENMLVGRQQEVLLSDFGLATLTQSSSSPNKSGQGTAGTIAYMAPEQIEGHARAASDQYALGVVVYEWLCGERPFEGSVTEVMVQHLSLPPPPLRERVPAILAEVEQVVLRALAKDPRERFTSVQNFALALEEACRTDVSAGHTLFALSSTSPADNRHTSIHNLPAPLTPLLGREQDVAVACTLLRRAEVRLVTLTGTGGVGKTRLGLQVAANLLEDFPDGVYFVSLAPLSQPDLVLPALAQTFGLKETPNWLPLEHLKSYLHEKQLLLLLDNLEQVIAVAPLLVELLQACPALKMLVTSRVRLRVSGEHEFSVQPLAVPDPLHLPEHATLMEYAAVALFVQRAQAIKPNFQFTAGNTRAIAECCLHLDGLPLAIELAAARIKLLSPQALLARLSKRLQVLTGGVQDAPVRQQTLRNTIAWSYDLLDAGEQRLFRRLSVFVGGATQEAIEVLYTTLGDEPGLVLDGISSLIDKSLLRQTEQEAKEPRFVMLETMREYGRDALVAHGEMEATRQAHAAYYLALVEAAEQEWEAPQESVWFVRLKQEHDNLRAAMGWLLERREAEMSLRLGAALWWFWRECGTYHEGWTFLERALEGSEEVAGPLRAKALLAAGNLAGSLGHYERGEALCQESLALYRAIGDTKGIGIAVFHLAEIVYFRGDLAAARLRFEESLVLARAVGYKSLVAWALDGMAMVAIAQGEYARARQLVEECLALFRTLGSKKGIAESLLWLAETMFSQGDLVRAHAVAEESLALNREIGNRSGEAYVLPTLAEITFFQGDTTTARLLLEKSCALWREVGNEAQIAWTLSMLAKVIAAQGDLAAAQTVYEESLNREKGVMYLDLAPALEGLAAVVAAQGEPTWAARLWGAAEAQREFYSLPLRPVYRADSEQAVAAARTQLGEQSFAAAWAEGRSMTPEQVLAARGAVTVPGQPQAIGSVKSLPTYPDGLTAREVEVLCLVAQGLSNAEIAEQLIISLLTVKAHMRSLYNKLGISSRSAATRYAIEHHLL